MSYHLTPIPRGTYGDLSKVYEEVAELKDAEQQGASLLILLELSDTIGAIEGYLQKHHPSLTLEDLLLMKDITARAFKSGARVSAEPSAEVTSSELKDVPAEFQLDELVRMSGGSNKYRVTQLTSNKVLIQCVEYHLAEHVGSGAGEAGFPIDGLGDVAWIQPQRMEHPFVKAPV